MSLYKRGGKWWVYLWQDGIRHQYSTGTSNRRQAQTIEAKLKEELNKQRFQIVETDPNITFGALAVNFTTLEPRINLEPTRHSLIGGPSDAADRKALYDDFIRIGLKVHALSNSRVVSIDEAADRWIDRLTRADKGTWNIQDLVVRSIERCKAMEVHHFTTERRDIAAEYSKILAELERLRIQLLEAADNSHGPPRRNPTRRGTEQSKPSRYAKIERLLREIEAINPSSVEAIVRELDGRVPPPNAKPFNLAGGWLKGFKSKPEQARSWISKRRAGLGLKPLPRGPK